MIQKEGDNSSLDYIEAYGIDDSLINSTPKVSQAMSFDEQTVVCLPPVSTLHVQRFPTPCPSLYNQQRKTQTPALGQLNIVDSTQLSVEPNNCQFVFSDCPSPINRTQSDSGRPHDVSSSINISDTSTVEDTNGEVEALAEEEPFTYLQGLNSDNLMKFSQQSALQLMLQEELDIKPNLNSLPTFEEHDNGGYKFQVNVNVCAPRSRNSKIGWVYSELLNKVYIRMNEIVVIDCHYTPKMPIQELRVRALMCFVKEVSEPVVRCQNHISKDNEVDLQKRHSLLRCENPAAIYCGTSDGKSLNDRYSVLVPLNVCAKPKGDKSITQQIALRFSCQNSCIGRKETSLLFLLEGMGGEILAQRVLHVKVCSCPKRDKSLDERHVTGAKRKMSEDVYAVRPKLHKPDTVCKDEYSRSSYEDNVSDENLHDQFHFHREPNTSNYVLTMKFKSRQLALSVMNSSLGALAREALNEPANGPKIHERSYRQLQRIYEEALKSQ